MSVSPLVASVKPVCLSLSQSVSCFILTVYHLVFIMFNFSNFTAVKLPPFIHHFVLHVLHLGPTSACHTVLTMTTGDVSH